jgi:flagella basal body P-ring formation protein FlgA
LPADLPADFEIGNLDYDPLSKRFRADVQAEGAGGPFALPIGGRIVVKRHVPVLARALEGGTIIGSADIEWADVSDDRIGSTTLTEADQLTGHELRHTVGENELLHAGDLMAPRLVKRGSLITMKIESPGMMLTARGKALQDGVEGETVRVVNTQSNRMIEGTVSGPDTVTVNDIQRLAVADGGG